MTQKWHKTSAQKKNITDELDHPNKSCWDKPNTSLSHDFTQREKCSNVSAAAKVTFHHCGQLSCISFHLKNKNSLSDSSMEECTQTRDDLMNEYIGSQLGFKIFWLFASPGFIYDPNPKLNLFINLQTQSNKHFLAHSLEITFGIQTKLASYAVWFARINMSLGCRCSHELCLNNMSVVANKQKRNNAHQLTESATRRSHSLGMLFVTLFVLHDWNTGRIYKIWCESRDLLVTGHIFIENIQSGVFIDSNIWYLHWCKEFTAFFGPLLC